MILLTEIEHTLKPTIVNDLTEFRCPDCRGPVVEFLWPIFMCMKCHQSRNEEQARTGREILNSIEVLQSKGDNHGNPS
jgi:hypothetical protein